MQSDRQFKKTLLVYITKNVRTVSYVSWNLMTDAFTFVDKPSPETIRLANQQSAVRHRCFRRQSCHQNHRNALAEVCVVVFAPMIIGIVPQALQQVCVGICLTQHARVGSKEVVIARRTQFKRIEYLPENGTDNFCVFMANMITDCHGTPVSTFIRACPPETVW